LSLNRSHDAEHLHHDGGANLTDQHGEHKDAERAAEEHAEHAIDLGEELGTHELSKHLEGVEAE